MKNKIFSIVLLLICMATLAQVPDGINYQAVVRNNSGNLITNQTVKFRLSILSNSETGTVVYSETQSVTTNAFGMANLKAGMGTPVSGTFNSIEWGSASHFMKVEIDPDNGSSFAHLGTTQLLAVPYALHAKTVEQIPDNSVTNAKIAPMGATSGQVLKWSGSAWAPAADNTSLWQQLGANIYYNNGNVGIGTDVPIASLHVTSNSAGAGNVVFRELSNISSDPPVSDGGARMMWYMYKRAIRAGFVAGTNWDKDSIGYYSVAFGYNPKAKGSASTAMGTNTFALGNYSTAMGNATTASGNYSTAMGYYTSAPSANETAIGRYNTGYIPASAIGWNINDRLFVIGNGTSNSARSNALTVLKNGNTGIGIPAPKTTLHVKAGNWNLATTDGDLLIGDDNHKLKLNMANGGDGAGIARINSMSSGTAQSVRLGTGGNDVLIVHGDKVGIGVTAPTYALTLPNSGIIGVGRAMANAWVTYSDGRLKTNRQTLPYGLEEVLQLKPLQYFMHDARMDDEQLVIEPEGAQSIGFIAQDVFKLMPEAVSPPENEDTGLWGLDYEKLTPVLVKAIQEQQNIIEELKAENDRLKEENVKLVQNHSQLNTRLEKLERLIGASAEN